MSVTVKIPTPLRRMTSGKDAVEVDANNILECIDALEAQFPGMKERLCTNDSELHRFVNVYVNGEDVRFLQGLSTALKASDEVSIVPAVAGG
ncbi:MAG: ubiquitin-like small modifier protein 1 [Dehalococcoidia bacterium]